MLTETGRVVRIDADGVWVQTLRRSACGACAARQGCGHWLLDGIAAGTRGCIRILPGGGAVGRCSIGDRVLIGIRAEVILRGSFVAYVMPLLAMLAGALASVYGPSGQQDLLAVVGAAGGLALGFALVRWHGLRHHCDPDFQPVLLEIDSPPAEPVTLR
jgi:sigma-E factor negative regulatory protein RseC